VDSSGIVVVPHNRFAMDHREYEKGETFYERISDHTGSSGWLRSL
jgi:hypothetical protein